MDMAYRSNEMSIDTRRISRAYIFIVEGLGFSKGGSGTLARHFCESRAAPRNPR